MTIENLNCHQIFGDLYVPRQAQLDHLCLQVGSGADRAGNRRMPLRMPKFITEGKDNFGRVGMKGGENLSAGVCPVRIAGREAILVYASKSQSEQGAQMGQNSTPSVHTANPPFLLSSKSSFRLLTYSCILIWRLSLALIG
jgi:hypothetical protein